MSRPVSSQELAPEPVDRVLAVVEATAGQEPLPGHGQVGAARTSRTRSSSS